MENKIKITVLFAVIISLFSACSNDEPTPPQLPDDNYEYSVDSLKDVAFALVKLQPTIEMCKEVHAATQKAISLGLDETYYFVEMLGKGEQITKSSEIKREILSKLATLPEDNNIKQLFDQMSENNSVLQKYQIYWPYSENWDGKEMPTITFKSKESPLIPQEENIGYLIKGEEVEDVLVNEEYAKTHPVWIINTNPIPYDEYPDFAVRNWLITDVYEMKDIQNLWREYNITKYTIYAKGDSEENVSNRVRPTYQEDLNSVDWLNDTLSLYLKQVWFNKKDSKLHSLFSGGAHYIFNIEALDINEFYPTDYSDCQKIMREYPETEYIGVRFVYLRSEMNENVSKIFDQLLSWRWLGFEFDMAISIVHEFGGKSFYLIDEIVDMFFFNTYQFRFGNSSFTTYLNTSGLFPIKLNDELIYYSDCYRYENPNDWPILSSASGLTFCKDEIETPSVNCLLDITKGISNPSWYTPVEE